MCKGSFTFTFTRHWQPTQHTPTPQPTPTQNTPTQQPTPTQHTLTEQPMPTKHTSLHITHTSPTNAYLIDIHARTHAHMHTYIHIHTIPQIAQLSEQTVVGHITHTHMHKRCTTPEHSLMKEVTLTSHCCPTKTQVGEKPTSILL